MEKLSVKPILVIRFPSFVLREEVDKLKGNKKIQQMDKEYHILTVNSPEVNDIQFEVFYEKDFNEVKYEELKEIIRNSIKENKNEQFKEKSQN